jgi:serine/threonine protein kinase/streptogramin lyase
VKRLIDRKTLLPLSFTVAAFGELKRRQEASMADRVDQQLGNYRLARLLGKGGFAEVYLGVHIHLGTEAAIKVLSTQLATAGEVEKFRQEARTLATLVHPNIIRVFDFDVVDSSPYLVMDYAPNGSLRQRFPQNTPLAPATFLPYLQHIAEALDYAHAHRFVHRDIKPENLLLGRNGEALLSDFGVATVAQTSSQQSTQNIAGTAAYMAPEQLQGHPRAASDLYSLGIIVYEWLTGDRPFRGSFTEIASQHVLAPPPPLRAKVPGIPPALEQVVLTALAKNPKDRFTSVRAFANAVAQASQQVASYTLATQGTAFTYGTNQAPAPAPGQIGSTISNAPTHVGSLGAAANLPTPSPGVSPTISDATTHVGSLTPPVITPAVSPTPPVWSNPLVNTPWPANTPPGAGWPPPQPTFNFAQTQAQEKPPAQPAPPPKPSRPGRVALIILLVLALILGSSNVALGLVGKGPLSFLDLRPTGTPATPTVTVSITPTFTPSPTVTARPNRPVGVVTEFGLPTSSASPAQITLGPDGNLWFTENDGNQIGRITPNGTVTEFSVPTPNSTPDGITIGPDGNLWFTENTANQIGRITPGGNITEFSIPTGDSHPSGITAGHDGNIWFGEVTANQIGRITPGGTISEFSIPTFGGRPSGMTLGPDGNVWFVEINASQIGRITPDGTISEFPLPTPNSSPNSITAGPDGNLWFVEGTGDKIGRITPGGAITEFPITAGSHPAIITRGPDGKLWFTERPLNEIGSIAPDGSGYREFSVPTAGSRPLGITPGPDQNLWFTEYTSNHIARITSGR